MSEKVHTLTLGELVSLIFACFLIGLIVVFVFVAIVAIIAFRRRYMSEPKNNRKNHRNVFSLSESVNFFSHLLYLIGIFILNY